MNTSPPHTVVLGLSPTGLYVARELGRAGISLLGVDKEFACGSVSRYFQRGAGTWHETSAQTLLTRLIHFSSALGSKPVLIPTSDYYIEFVVENYSRLSRYFCISKSYEDVAGLLLDKLKFHKLCVKHDIDSPGVWELSSIDELNGILDEVPIPCILKPTLIHLARPYMRGKKVFVASSRQELIDLGKSLPKEAGSWLIQEIIPGAESRITLLAGYTSESVSANDVFTARKLRQYPPGFGSASRVISQNCDETKEITTRLINATGFNGIYGSEFKRDPRDGKLKIIEINPRPTLWFYASHAAGKRLVERAYCDLAGLPIPDKLQQRNGVVWQYLFKDYSSALFYRFTGGKFVFPPPDISAGGPATKRCFPVFSFADPLPCLAELYVYATKFVRRLF